MCGFITVINPIGSHVDANACREAVRILTHRGPDASGEWISDNSDVYMGFRRLSIIDLSDAANQPMIGKTGKVLVFNGEIYNFRLLRAELESLGSRFKTQSDTEVLLQALETWGIEGLKKLEGMFAFVLWDINNKKATIVRDFFGIKPLYVWKMRNGGVAVASEIKAFYALPDFHPELNTEALPEYLRFRCLCAEQTLLKDVCQVQPGELYHYSQERGILDRSIYWNIVNNLFSQDMHRSKESLVEDFLNRFTGTVERHLIADVKVGTQFSGGIDSTLTSAISVRDLNASLTGFHCHVPHARVDETPYASSIAEHLNMQIQCTTLDSATFFSDLLETLTWHMDEPVGHPNAIGVYLVSRLAHGQAKVLLSGEGADEAFAGYYRYRRINLAASLRRKPFALTQAARFINFLPKRLHKIINIASRMTSDEQVITDMQFVHPAILANLFLDSAYEEKSVQRRQPVLNEFKAQDELIRCQIFDIKTYLPSLLVRQDKMSMAASIENRVPFLTPEICSFALSLPNYMRSSGLSTKVLLKKALACYIPKALVYRTKVGFELPLGEWFLTDLGRTRLDSMISSNSSLHQVLDKQEVNRVVRNFDGTHDPADLLWMLLTLKTWMDLFLGDKKNVTSVRT